MPESVTLIGLEDRAGWDAALGLHGLPSQAWGHAFALAAEGIVPQLAVVRAGGAEMLLPFHTREWRGEVEVVTLPGLSGALVRPDDAAPLALWRAFAAERGWVCGYLQLSVPNRALVAAPPDRIRSHNALFVFDLETWSLAGSVSRNTRKTIAAGDRAGAGLVTDRDRLTAEFPALHAGAMERAGGAPLFGAECLRRWCAEPEAVIFGAEVAGRIHAAQLGRRRGDWAELHLAGTTELGRPLQAWLIVQACAALRAGGVRWVNIGGYGSRGDGLHRMKSRFNIDEYPLQSLRQVYRPDLFAKLCADAGADPEALYFPPWRAPRSAPEPETEPE